MINTNTLRDRDLGRWGCRRTEPLIESSALGRLTLHAIFHLGLKLFDLKGAIEEIVFFVHPARSFFQHGRSVNTGFCKTDKRVHLNVNETPQPIELHAHMTANDYSLTAK